MGWRTCYDSIKRHIESEEFKTENRKSNPNDPETALAIALRKLYSEKNPWGHKI